MEELEQQTNSSSASPRKRKNTLSSYFPAKKVANRLSGPLLSFLERIPNEKENKKTIEESKQESSILGTSNVTLLPREILAFIFSFLTKKDCIIVGTVCNQWRNANAFIETLDLTWCNHLQKTHIPESLIKSMRGLRNLKLGKWESILGSAESIFKNCTSLTALTIDETTRLSGKLLRSIAGYCTSLERLSWRYCDYISEEMMKLLIEGKDIGIKAYFAPPLIGCSNLVKLDIRGTSKIHIDALSVIVNKCVNITSLKVSDSQFIDRWYLNNTCRAVSLLSSMPKLKSLGFGGFHLGTDILEHWTKFAGNLQTLELSNTFPNSVVELMLAELTNVRKLDISNSSIEDKTIEQILQKCTALTKLDISYNSMLTSHSFHLIVRSSHLKEVRCCSTWTEEDFLELDVSSVLVKLKLK